MARFSDEALAGLRDELRKHAATAPIGEPMRVATGVMQTLLEMAAIANLRTERPRAQYRRVELGDFVSERQRRDWDDVTSVGAPDDAGDPDD